MIEPLSGPFLFKTSAGLAGAALLLLAAGCAGPTAAPALPASASAWPHFHSAIARDPALEARVAAILAGMTLVQKVGQMTQPEIKSITPAEVTQHYIGSVLNGGGSRPGGNKRASLDDWLSMASAYHRASMATDMAVKVPIIWGTDAVHGHNNVFGATVFPHNIGLGATRNPQLVGEIASATGKAVRASGIQWVFAPTLAVARDDRWGRTYESFSEDPALVEAMGGAVIQGLQGRFDDDANVVATVKHFIGDGGTQHGKDQGVNRSSRDEMIALHSRGYRSALAAGAQTVMASFNSWHDRSAGIDHGKLHGSRALLTDVLKTEMGFDGFVVSDWNGIGQVPGCSNASCAQAINAGIDMVMVPDDWLAFIGNTVAQVKSGAIPIGRIDDAVTRILRVKLRAGLFDKSPAQGSWAGRTEALQARGLARRAVQQSLVLLKNHRGLLPLARGQRLLVVGKSADSLQNQTGGWTLSWQGADNHNHDFPVGDTILAGIRQAAGSTTVVFSETAAGVDVRQFDSVIAVLGETPYAEGTGDIPLSGTLRHSSRHPEDLAVLQRVAGQGVPVVTIFLSGRPLHVNDLLNQSDAFVAAWLPGTEGKGVADLLFRDAQGQMAQDFSGRLSFSWPKAACQTTLNAGDADYAPLFALGYGLRYASPAEVGLLDTHHPTAGCGAQAGLSIFNQSAQAPYVLQVASSSGRWPAIALETALDATLAWPAGRPEIQVSTVQLNTQQDAKLVRWSGPARFFARSAQPVALDAYPAGALEFDIAVASPAQASVLLSLGCGPACSGSVDITRLLARLAGQARASVKIPLACFAQRGANLARVDEPFSISTDGRFAAAFALIRITAGTAQDADATSCDQLLATAP